MRERLQHAEECLRVFAVLTTLLFMTHGGSNAEAEDNNPLLNGLYTAAQAQRGQQAYAENCASCHAGDLRGNSNSPGLVGLGFLFLWEGRPLGELFEKMRNEMPTDRPGTLPLDTYLDLTAFLLQANQYPSADKPLTADILESAIAIVSPPQ